MSAWEDHGESNDWYTPRYIFDALGCEFDLDVAAPLEGPLHVPCDEYLCAGGLEAVWSGFVWMNPPFGHQKNKLAWLRKFLDHANGIALLPDRSSTLWWQEAAMRSDAILAVYGKIKFIRPDGSIGEQPGTGTTLFGVGRKAIAALKRAEKSGLGLVLSKHDYLASAA